MQKKHFVTQPKGAEYFRKREAEERAAAGRATNVKARAAHEDMAVRYHQLTGDPDQPKTAAADAGPVRAA